MRDRRKDRGRHTWWTRERVLLGLQRLRQDTGQSPTGRLAYRNLVRARDCGKWGANRRYPSEHAIMRHWPSLAQAWRAAGMEGYGRRELVSASEREGLRWIRPRQIGERHGRLVVVEFAGYRERERDRIALWRCVCDCGGERIVEAGRLKSKRECEACALGRMLSCIRAGAEAARRAAQVQTSVLIPSTREHPSPPLPQPR